jgi:hypothetical protein
MQRLCKDSQLEFCIRQADKLKVCDSQWCPGAARRQWPGVAAVRWDVRQSQSSEDRAVKCGNWGMYSFGICCQAKHSENTADWEELVREVVSCRVCKFAKVYICKQEVLLVYRFLHCHKPHLMPILKLLSLIRLVIICSPREMVLLSPMFGDWGTSCVSTEKWYRVLSDKIIFS